MDILICHFSGGRFHCLIVMCGICNIFCNIFLESITLSLFSATGFFFKSVKFSLVKLLLQFQWKFQFLEKAMIV